MNWQTYQERVADLFRDLGCSAEIEAAIKGVRSDHVIDVWVSFNKFGLEHKWVVECKNWDSRIPKEKILTLKSIVDDVGADKGILVAKSGFQPGAISAATSTNILLTTLTNLQALAENDLRNITLENLERSIIDLRCRCLGLYTHEKNKWGSVSSPKSGVDSKNYIKTYALLGTVEHGLERVKMDQFPAPVDIDFDTDCYRTVESSEEFAKLAGKTIERVSAWVSRQEAAIEKALNESNAHA